MHTLQNAAVCALNIIAALSFGLMTHCAHAEDWGAYSLVPASAQMMVLAAADAGTAEGSTVTIGKPAGGANQKWSIVPKGDGFFSIKPISNPALVLAAGKGGANPGATIVLEKESGE